MPCPSPRRRRAAWPASEPSPERPRRPRAPGGSARVIARVQARPALLPLLAVVFAGVAQGFRLLPAPYFEHRQPAFAQLVAAGPSAVSAAVSAATVGINVRLDAAPNPALTSGIAAILQGQLGRRPEELSQVERLLEVAAMGMPVAAGGEWVLMALAATRLTPAAKASPAGQRFQAALARGLPARLEVLEPGELVCLVNGWPRGGLDGLGRHIIQACIEACIERLDEFGPAELAQLVRGLCRPVTNTRLETLKALDAVAEETPDVNARSRLFKAATKVLSRRIAELGPADLAAFAQACSTEMSLQDGCKDLGPAFPRAYTRAVAAHLPSFTLPELLPIVATLLFARTAFRSPLDAALLARAGEAVLRRLAEEATTSPPAPAVVLPLLVGFALLGADGAERDHPEADEGQRQYSTNNDYSYFEDEEEGKYDPAAVLAALTLQAHARIDAVSPAAARLLLETLALPGHSYTPPAGVLAAFAHKAAGQLWSASTSPLDVAKAARSLVGVVSRGATQGLLGLRWGGSSKLL